MLVNTPQLSQYFDKPPDTKCLLNLLLSENPLTMQTWSKAFEPISSGWLPSLVDRMRASNRAGTSLNAVNLHVAYATDDIEILASVVPTAQPNEVVVFTIQFSLVARVA